MKNTAFTTININHNVIANAVTVITNYQHHVWLTSASMRSEISKLKRLLYMLRPIKFLNKPTGSCTIVPRIPYRKHGTYQRNNSTKPSSQISNIHATSIPIQECDSDE